jgi:hypothetical protein
MKRLVLCLCGLLIAAGSFAQSISSYDAKEAFNPQFYPYPGNDFRSASGAPGLKYWQNRADYKINCTLDTLKHAVSGEVQLTYTNNSPDNLKFLWLQLDQNIYRKDSRASATTTETGGRWANAKFTNGDVIKTISAEYNGKSFTPKYVVTDTRRFGCRMPCKTPVAKSNSPLNSSLRYRNTELTGWAGLTLRMVGSTRLANGFPVCVFMMIYRDGMCYLILARENSILNMAT